MISNKYITAKKTIFNFFTIKNIFNSVVIIEEKNKTSVTFFDFTFALKMVKDADK